MIVRRGKQIDKQKFFKAIAIAGLNQTTLIQQWYPLQALVDYSQMKSNGSLKEEPDGMLIVHQPQFLFRDGPLNFMEVYMKSFT